VQYESGFKPYAVREAVRLRKVAFRPASALRDAKLETQETREWLKLRENEPLADVRSYQ
jgi:hypothetical protein